MSRTRLCTSILILLALALPVRGQSARVSYSDGRPSESIAVLDTGGETYLPVPQISRLLGLESAVDHARQEVVFSDAGQSLKIPVEGTVWIREGQTIAAGQVSLRQGEEVYISLPAVEKNLAPAFGRTLRWEPSSRRIMVGLPAPNILDLEVQATRQRVIATIKTLGKLQYDLMPVEDRKIELLIRGGAFSKQLDFDSEGSLIERVRARQETNGTRLTFTLGPGDPAYRVFPRWNPDGIVVLVWTRALTDIPDPEFRPPRTLAWSDRFSPERLPIDLVVVDPGHGGENFGSMGPSGYAEKLFNMEVSRRLKVALEREGIEVILTRNDDVFVDLETRTEVANSVGADLFISMHANGYRSPEANGFEVYFLSPALDDQARTVAAMENAASSIVPAVAPGDDELAFILWDTAQNEFVVESSHLAQLVNEEMAKRLTIRNRGVKQASFVVLAGVYLPAVLVETAFITNPREEQLLKDEAFQEMVVNAVVEAIMRFKEHYGR